MEELYTGKMDAGVGGARIGRAEVEWVLADRQGSEWEPSLEELAIGIADELINGNDAGRDMSYAAQEARVAMVDRYDHDLCPHSSRRGWPSAAAPSTGGWATIARR